MQPTDQGRCPLCGVGVHRRYVPEENREWLLEARPLPAPAQLSYGIRADHTAFRADPGTLQAYPPHICPAFAAAQEDDV